MATTMKHTLVTLALPLLVLTGCGGGDKSDAGTEPTSAPSFLSAPSSSPSATSSPSAQAVLQVLSEAALKNSLIELDDVPPGFTADEPDVTSTTKTFCDYKPRYDEKTKVSANFTDDAGQRFVSATLRQYASANQARTSFDELVNELKTCKRDQQDGTSLTYSRMSAPSLGDGSTGVQIEGSGYTAKQYFVLSGPTLISTGGIGVDAGEVADLAKNQTRRHQDAAR